MATDPSLPLTDVRVLDVAPDLAGRLAAMLLADQGADVVRLGPATGGTEPFNAVLDRGKRVVEGMRSSDLERLVPMADLVFAGPTSDELTSDAYRGVVVVTTPAIPSDHPLAEGLADPATTPEGIVAALTGQYTGIHAVRELFGLDPVYTALPLASVYAGVHAATAAMLALREREAGRATGAIEASLAGAAMSAMSSILMRIERQPDRYDAPRLPRALKSVVLPLLRKYARAGGEERQRKVLDIARKSYPALMTSYPCSDGRLLYIFAIDNAKIVKALLAELGLDDAAAQAGLRYFDPYASDRRDNLADTSNLSRANQGKLKSLLTEALKTKPAAVWEECLNAAGVPCAIQRTTEEWVGLPQMSEAALFETVDDPHGGGMRQFGRQVWLDGPAPEAAELAPRRMVAADAVDWPARQAEGTVQPARPASRWLEGIKVIDLCSMVAGPVAARTLAEHGAEVIKVEPPVPNHGPRLVCWYAVDGAQGKRSALIDLKTDEGRAAFASLVRSADVLVTNHAPAALAWLGLSDDELEAMNPRLIRCRVAAYEGPRGGPWADRPGYDPVLQAAAGIMDRYGDEGHPELHAIASCVDALTGYSAVLGVAMALRAHANDSKGRRVTTSLAAAASLAQSPFAFSYEGRVWDEPRGQAAKGTGALERLYRAKDGWLFVAAPKAGHEALPKALRPRTGDLAEGLARKVRRLPRARVLDLLRRAGLTAAPVITVPELRDVLLKAPPSAAPRLLERDVPQLGEVLTVAPPQLVVGGEPLAPLPAAEKPGASTEAVLRQAGADPAAMLASGAAASEVADAFLPS